MTPRVVFDCMIFLQAAGRPAGPARACLQLVEVGRAMLYVSPDILSELRDVLNRPNVLRRFPLLTPDWNEHFVQNVESKALLLTGVPKSVTIKRDPKDEPYVNLAIAISADYLVSRDQDLLVLMNDEQFRQRYPSLTILDPVTFLRTVAISGSADGSDLAATDGNI